MTDQKRPFILELSANDDGKIKFFYKPVSDERIAQIVLFASDGYTQKEIAEKLGIGQGTVSKKLKKIVEDGYLKKTGNGYQLEKKGEEITGGMRMEE